MRIIGGDKKNIRIHAPATLPARPTTDRTKESVINILWNVFDFEDIAVLDLFSGTGNMAYEFASRGAIEVVAVEENAKAIQFIRDTAKRLDFDNLRVIKSDVFTFMMKDKTTYDVIYADPPYDMEEISLIREYVFEHHLLNPGGWLLIEHSKRDDLSGLAYHAESRKYGRTVLSIFKFTE
ncbi:MAG: RsmD family RNA methyltransferase [Bacteroidales bacterium]|nr:RsmD family RNA methyltransferase [Bacteroidales bacterium]